MLNRLIAGVLIATVPGIALAGEAPPVPSSGAGLVLAVAVIALYLFKKLRG
ncbi:MAG: hypothetical protein ACKOBM_16200 [Gammaproteobacteria bacterium]